MSTAYEIELRDETDLTPKQKTTCRMIRRNVAQMHRLLNEIEKATDPQERHAFWDTIDTCRTFSLPLLLKDAIEFAQSDDKPEEHLSDDAFAAWERDGSPSDVAGWLANRSGYALAGAV